MRKVVELGSRRVNLDTGRIEPNGALRPMELRMLRYLAARPEVVVSTAELLREVWQYSGKARTRTVTTTLHRLRQALEADPASPRHLETVAGHGIRLRTAGAVDPPRPRRESDAFVGRQAELRVLESSDARLITILGPGGAGKTRLALEHLRAHRGPGSWFCDLTETRTSREAAEVVGATLGLSMSDPTTHLGSALHLRDDRLVILDNLESVEDDVGPMLSRWLSDAPSTRFVATSLRRVGIRGEQILPVGPLALPLQVDALEGDAVELFVARVRANDATFEPERHAAAVVALVHALDGLPLALELAAPHAAVLGPAGALEALQVHGTLTSRRSDRPPRHASLDKIVAWSWARLPGWARQPTADLQLFSRPFDLEGAEAVAGGSLPVHELLAELVERGLLQRRVGEDGEVRFAPFESVRRYLKAAAPPSAEGIERYVGHFRARADAAYAETAPIPRPARGVPGTSVEELIHAARIAVDHAPRQAGSIVGYALHQAAVAGLWRSAECLIEQALAADLDPVERLLVEDPHTLWLHRAGRADESFELRRRLPGEAAAAGRPDLAAFYAGAAVRTLLNVGRLEDAREALARCEAYAEAAGHPPGGPYGFPSVFVDLAAGGVALREANPAAAEPFRRAMAFLRSRDIADDLLFGTAMDLVGALTRTGAVEEAEAELREWIQPIAERGFTDLLALAYACLASLLEQRGAVAEARDRIEEALRLFEHHGTFVMIPQARLIRARLALRRGDLDGAEADAELSRAGSAGFRDHRTEAGARLVLARLARERGLPDAADRFREAVHATAASGDARETEAATRAYAELLIEQGRPDEALAAIDRYLAATPPDPLACRLRALRAELGHRVHEPTGSGHTVGTASQDREGPS